MNIHARKGDKVIYIGTSDMQVNWGGCDDPRGTLQEGQEYSIDHTEVHSWHTKIILEGIAGQFPSTAFKDGDA